MANSSAVRGDFSHLEGICQLRVFQGGALRAEPHRHSCLLGGGCQGAVDLPGLFGAAGHRRDQQRSVQAFSEELLPQVDRFQVQLGQRPVD